MGTNLRRLAIAGWRSPRSRQRRRTARRPDRRGWRPTRRRRRSASTTRRRSCAGGSRATERGGRAGAATASSSRRPRRGPRPATGDVWDSGEVALATPSTIDYAGPALASRTRYFWSVRHGRDRRGVGARDLVRDRLPEPDRVEGHLDLRSRAHAERRSRNAAGPPTTPAACRATRRCSQPPPRATGSCAWTPSPASRPARRVTLEDETADDRDRRHRARQHDGGARRRPPATRTSRSPRSPTSRRARR